MLMTNAELKLAEDFVLNTNQTLFVTGKAGTGKTTFLKNILNKTSKNAVVTAPTGVAAINAGGVTLHSMFHLPLTAFIPNNDFVDFNIATNQTGLSKHLKFRKDKRKVIEEMELLVIDEISMVRCDVLDAIDFVLRFVKRNSLPFGGVQLLVIGDLYQLPPVTRDNIWGLLQNYYENPYFFKAHAWQKVDPVIIELKKIYRQNEQTFINILNEVRNANVSNESLELLNQNYNPHFNIPEDDHHITLTTHNRKADAINQNALNELPGKTYTYYADIDGTFNENAYPMDAKLELKTGAQIMFIKNDVESGRYYNGKLAEVTAIKTGLIYYKFHDNDEEFTLEKTEWENTNYFLDKESNQIKQETLGTFTHYPIRLAWAVTIHKSQGLTFTKAVVDVGQSFASGQVYVALSRCTNLEGLVLKSRVNKQNVIVDKRITQLYDAALTNDELESILEHAKLEYAFFLMQKAFNFLPMRFEIEEWRNMMLEKELPEKEKCIVLANTLMQQSAECVSVARKFENQLKKIINQYRISKDASQLKERNAKAIGFFTTFLHDKLIQPLHKHIQDFAYKSRVKKYLTLTQELYDNLWLTVNKLYNLSFLGEKLFAEAPKHSKNSYSITKTSATAKQKKGSTYQDTLTLYKKGLNAKQIAEMRGMAETTIQGHLTKWVETGDIDIFKLMAKKRVNEILPHLKDSTTSGLTQLKNKLPFETTYAELRMVVAHLKWKTNKNNS